MATTQDKITALEGTIGRIEEERENAVGDERRDKLLDAINHLYTQLEREQQQQQQQQGMSLILFMIFILHIPPVLTIV